MSDLIERLRFHGRYATETNYECASRKNAEREQAAAEIEALRKERDEALQSADRWREAQRLVFTRAESAEALLAEAGKALEQIATGEIVGEPRNHRDTVDVMRGVARSTLSKIGDRT